jgi:hypothetical protein
MMSLALFSKATMTYVPLFLIYKTWKDKRYKWSLAFGAIFLIHFALAFRAAAGYLAVIGNPASRAFEPGLNLSIWGRITGAGLHWLEAMLLLVLPIPFFSYYSHFLLYLVGLAGIVYCLRLTAPNANSDALYLFLLASIPFTFSSEIRLAGLASFFGLICIFQRATIVKPRPILYVSTALVLISFVISGQMTKVRMQTDCFTPQIKDSCMEKSFSVNDHYKDMRKRWLSSFDYYSEKDWEKIRRQ